MKFYHCMAILVIVFILPLSARDMAKDPMNEKFIAAAEKAVNSVVYIGVYTVDRKTGKNHKVSYGSGVILTDMGYVVTNYHVVKDGSSFQVLFPDSKEASLVKFADGEYFQFDRETDIAIMRINTDVDFPIEPIRIADSSSVKTGEWAIAVGNPYGLNNSITSGVISSVGRYDVGFTEIEDFLQTDVPINPGNSGGPLVNINGEMIGINTAIRSSSGGFEGISFSIPSNLVMKIFNDLSRFGRVKRGWLGMVVKDEREFGGSGRKLVKIQSVVKDSPASFIGLLPGDVILEADNQQINSKGQLQRIVKTKQVGTDLQITVSRAGKMKGFSLPIKEKTTYQMSGRQVGNLFDRYGIELDLSTSGNDIIVTSVSRDKYELNGNNLREGDIITGINGENVRSIEEFAAVYRSNGYKLYSLSVIRENRKLELVIGDEK